jgi:hypothetical protein
VLFIKTRNTHANYNMPNCFQITPIYIFCTINMLPPQIPCADWPYISPGQLHSARSRESLIYLLGLFDLKTSLVHRKNKHAKIDRSSLQDLLTFQEHLRSLVTTGFILLGSCRSIFICLCSDLRSLFVLFPFVFVSSVCLSTKYSFMLPLSYLQTFSFYFKIDRFIKM